MPKPIVLDPAILANLDEQWRSLNDRRWPPDELLDRVFCSRAEDFLSTLPDSSVDMILTDEPYGIAGGGIITFTSRKFYQLQFDFDADLPVHLTIPWVKEAARVLKEGGVLVNCGAETWSTSFQNICEWSGLTFRKQGVWIKTNPPTRVRAGGWKSAYERIWVASKGSLSKRLGMPPQAYLNNWVIEATCPHCATRFPVTWSHNYTLTDGEWWQKWLDEDDVFVEPSKAHHDRLGHPNEKPDWLPAFYLSLLTKEGDVVVDPFTGSGVFPAMAHRMGRHYIANDYDEKYVEMTQARLSSLQPQMF